MDGFKGQEVAHTPFIMCFQFHIQKLSCFSFDISGVQSTVSKFPWWILKNYGWRLSGGDVEAKGM